MRPIHVIRLQGLRNQQPSHPRAVNKEVSLYFLAIFQNYCFDSSIGRALQDLRDLAFGALHAQIFGKLAQKAGVQTGVKMKRMGKITQG